ncbi:MAG TPA: CRISPR-associated endonuclease Cas3'' [Candidatus Paceibacterota bacterium]|nr:CRISPR-associated endonuclease Cas3'' [Verrucomicrobiota bacterium]HRZ46669.1 CRISPR-associated endonuclease Cas3'' [Candidatus Paceibacterota bacterium]
MAGKSPDDWLRGGTDCRSRLIHIPTGLGKTAAVVLAWLWNRLSLQSAASSEPWPRRLAYCLPMRTLVEQTEAEVGKWLRHLQAQSDRLGIRKQAQEDLEWLIHHSPVILMGGEENEDARLEWDVHPEKPAILIGTQDMLLSRALNRGYGMSRYRWPMHFGLLNNDCLWVMDETQLMGAGLETSAQLDGFRQDGKMPVLGSCPTWWMSATLDESRLATADHSVPENGWLRLDLSEAERANGKPRELFEASKRIARCPFTLSFTTKASYAKTMAAMIRERHHLGTLTLAVLNRVSRAREVYEALIGGKNPLCDPSKVSLIHSRFRRPDRKRHESLLWGQGDRIVIATQAIEAGVDVSARLLITELAPWSSLVQRLGRCNRRADFPDAEAIWIDIEPKDEQDDLLLPYTRDELAKARAAIDKLGDASPRALHCVQVQPKRVVRPVIRRRDLVELFDTTPDLCGQDLDISRYIRDGEDSDVQFFWREIQGDAPAQKEPPPRRDELCPISIGDAAQFLSKKMTHAWRWNPLAAQWEDAKAARPGAVYLVAVASGGYRDDLGWTRDPEHKPTAHPPTDGAPATYAGNRLAFAREWQTIAAHTQHVVQETRVLCASLGLDPGFSSALSTAALWHDVGKAHNEFQKMLSAGDAPRGGELWAKSANRDGQCSRPGFRHELASALAWLLAGPADAAEHDLVAYLIAAHHGKVRLSIRSLPGETGDPKHLDAPFARGIWRDDPLPAVPLGHIATPPLALDLGFMQMGQGQHGPSWLARTIALRDLIGPFHLAFLETILRAADARASSCPIADPEGASSGIPDAMEFHDPGLPWGGAAPLSQEEQSLVAELVGDGLSIQKKFRPEPLYKRTGKGHYEGGTVEEIRRAREAGMQGGKP